MAGESLARPAITLGPVDVPKADLDKWAALTPQAMGAWTAIKAPAK